MRQIINLLVNIFVGFFVVQEQVLHMVTKRISNKYGIENYSSELRNPISTDLDEYKGLRIAAKNNDD